MIVKKAYQGVTAEVGKMFCQEAKDAQPNAVTEMIQQADGLWTVTISYDDGTPAPSGSQ